MMVVLLSVTNFIQYHPLANPVLWLYSGRYKENPTILSTEESDAMGSESEKWFSHFFEESDEVCSQQPSQASAVWSDPAQELAGILSEQETRKQPYCHKCKVLLHCSYTAAASAAALILLLTLLLLLLCCCLCC
jgi:hypothetical protein